MSGSASATIATQLLANFEFSFPQVIGLIMSALAAGLTVGGKAIGKSYAVNYSTQIVYFVGKLICWFQDLPTLFQKKKSKK